MPFDPNTPRSRDEVLLQAIVSGDSSMMGDPRDREEEFVKAIADKETLPDYSEASDGDVLRIGTDGPEWGAVPNELPAIAAGDAGRVLKVNAGETGTEWGTVPNELPAIAAGDAGKVLKVNAGETGAEWGAVPNELPAIAAGDAGKVLKVNSGETGTEWGTSGSTLYRHLIKGTSSGSNNIVMFDLITNQSSAYTSTTLKTAVYVAGATNVDNYLPASGCFLSNTNELSIIKGVYWTSTSVDCASTTIKIDNGALIITGVGTRNFTFNSDTVKQL